MTTEINAINKLTTWSNLLNRRACKDRCVRNSLTITKRTGASRDAATLSRVRTASDRPIKWTWTRVTKWIPSPDRSAHFSSWSSLLHMAIKKLRFWLTRRTLMYYKRQRIYSTLTMMSLLLKMASMSLLHLRPTIARLSGSSTSPTERSLWTDLPGGRDQTVPTLQRGSASKITFAR